MEVILSEPVTTQRQIQTRSNEITIKNPANGDVNIRFKGENLLIIDGVPPIPLPCPDVIRNLMGVVTEINTITDPVTGQEVTISVGGMAEVIAKLFCNWYREDDARRAAAEAERQAALAAIEAARLAAEEEARAAAEARLMEADAARIAAEAAAIEAARIAAEEEAARLAAEAAANP